MAGALLILHRQLSIALKLYCFLCEGDEDRAISLAVDKPGLKNILRDLQVSGVLSTKVSSATLNSHLDNRLIQRMRFGGGRGSLFDADIIPAVICLCSKGTCTVTAEAWKGIADSAQQH